MLGKCGFNCADVSIKLLGGTKVSIVGSGITPGYGGDCCRRGEKVVEGLVVVGKERLGRLLGFSNEYMMSSTLSPPSNLVKRTGTTFSSKLFHSFVFLDSFGFECTLSPQSLFVFAQ